MQRGKGTAVALILMAMAAMGSPVVAQNDSTAAGAGKLERAMEWKLVRADQVNKKGAPDPKNWKFETGFARNEEFQWHQSQNARSDKGCRIIEGKRERRPNPNFEAGSGDWKKKRKFFLAAGALRKLRDSAKGIR